MSGGETYPDRLRLPLTFDPGALAGDLELVSTVPWTAHFVRGNYDGEWSAIPLRAPAGEVHPIRMITSDPGCTEFEDTPVLAACPYFRTVLESLRCPLHAVRLMRLGPGSVIKEHSDHDLRFEDGMVRIHIPVTTNAEVDFRLNGRRVRLDAGTVWYLRLSDPHSVANRGDTARVHLVIDAVVDDWLTRLFRRAAAVQATSAPEADEPQRADQGASNDVDRLHASILGDAALQRALYAIEGETAFLQAAQKMAGERRMQITADMLRARMLENRQKLAGRRRVR